MPGFNFDNPFAVKKRRNIGVRQSYQLTPLGKVKAEEFSLSGPKWEAMAVLNENGPSSISEIADEMKTTPEKVKSIVRQLIGSGYVQRVGNEG